MGLGLQYEFPVISVVRSESAKNLLPSLGAKHVLVQELSEVENELLKTASELGATAVFEGLGGSFITRHATAFPERASLFCYGSSGGPDLISIPMRTLMSKELTVKSFSNFRSPTLQDPTSLDEAFRASVGSCICRYFNQEYTRNSNPRKSKKRSHSQVRDTEKR